MDYINVTNARQNLYGLLNDVNLSHKPVHIAGKNGNGVLLAEEDWLALQETIFLSAVPGMADSIRDGMNTPLEQCVPLSEVEW